MACPARLIIADGSRKCTRPNVHLTHENIIAHSVARNVQSAELSCPDQCGTCLHVLPWTIGDRSVIGGTTIVPDPRGHQLSMRPRFGLAVAARHQLVIGSGGGTGTDIYALCRALPCIHVAPASRDVHAPSHIPDRISPGGRRPAATGGWFDSTMDSTQPPCPHMWLSAARFRVTRPGVLA